MNDSLLWKYCTPAHCREMLLSLDLLDRKVWPDDKYLACLYSFSNHPDEHYRSIRIAKRNGTIRQLYEPDPLLKLIQKNILHQVLMQFAVSPYATAYQKGSTVRANAAVHSGQEVILKLDIENFFDHVMFHMVFQHAFPAVYFPVSVRTLLAHLCCRNECLPQGAPTSAYISNLVLIPFDEYIGSWCSEQGITYSRYCDDITCSGSFNPAQVTRKISAYLQTMGFYLNGQKTRIIKQGQCQIVTGVVVNQKLQVPRTYRDQIRQELHYCRKFGVAAHLAFIHDQQYLPQASTGILKYLDSLMGRICYILSINPDDEYFSEGARWVRLQSRELADGSKT